MTNKLSIQLFDCSTGETIEREMTENEKIEYTKITDDHKVYTAQMEARAAARASALAKLAALGLSPEEIAAL
jgi:tryptophanyl-tRNA synthetase